MKKNHHFWFLLVALAWFASPIFNAQAQSANSLFAEGKRLYAERDFVGAKQRFDQILKYNPRHPARAYSFRAQQAIKQGLGSRNGMEAQMAKIIVPSIAFEDVPLGDALNYVRQRSQELTGGKVTPNLVFQGNEEQKQTGITMRLSNIPMTALLKYIADQSRCRVKYEQYAIIVAPLSKVQQQASNSSSSTDPLISTFE